MKSKTAKWLVPLVAIGLLITALAIWGQQQTISHADPVLRFPAVPAGSNPNLSQSAPAPMTPIEPVVVNVQDLTPGVYDPDNMYDRWLRGEIDPRENDFRKGEQFTADRIAEALAFPENPAIQTATSGSGLDAPVPGVGFASLDYNECCGGGGSVPPDPEMAAGPNHLIAAVNVSFEIYDKAGNTLVASTTLDSLLSPAGGGCTSTFDPNTVYDEEADRYIIAADGNGTDFCIAVSQTNDPTGDYNVYRVPAQIWGGEFHDYPHTGVGDSYIVVGANQFDGNIPNAFEGRIWALDKAVMYAGGALTPVTASVGYDGGTPQPLHLHGYNQGTWPNLGSTHYIATDFYDGCRLDIWQWNIPSAPSIVATFDLCTASGITGGMPINFPQSGGSPIQGNDWRMRGFEYRNGSGWIADSISCNPGGGTVNCARWSQVNLNGTPTLTQVGVYASTGQYRNFPDLAVNQCNDMALGYTKSSTSMFPSVWATGRESGDPLGTLQAEVQVKAGEIAYIAFDGTPYRWGDYTGMTIDPDGVTFWYLGEYSKVTGNPSGRWGTYISSMAFPNCTGGDIPDITLTQTVGTNPAECAVTDAITVAEGSDVTYCYSVENTGTVTMTMHTLTDSEWGSILNDFAYSLAPGASTFITQTETILATTINTGTWTAENPAIPATAEDSDSTTVTTFAPAEITVDSSGLGATQVVSQVVTYPLVIGNNGEVPLDWTIVEGVVSGGETATGLCPAPADIPWASVSPDNGTTQPGNNTTVDVTYDTNGLTAGTLYTGTLCITSNDPVAPQVAVSLSLYVEAPTYGVSTSGPQATSADAGTTVTYTVTVTNTGNVTDTFDLSAEGAWPVSVSQPAITLSAGASASFTVEVTIPANISNGSEVVITVTATSQTDPTATVSTDITITAISDGYFLFLPLTIR